MEEVVQEGGRRGEKVSGRGEAKKRGGEEQRKDPHGSKTKGGKWNAMPRKL